MAFPASFIDELIRRNPIEEVVGQYITLMRKGSNQFGLCPFHGEKTASFSVEPSKQMYYCFGCHRGGGVINFIMEIENLSYPDAVRYLAKRVNLEVPDDGEYQHRYQQQERLWELCKEAARFFHTCLYGPEGKEALQYAAKRGIAKGILISFGLGYAPDSWDSLVKAMTAKGFTRQELVSAGLVGEKNDRIYDRFRNRFMFPIIDVRGNIIGFGGRVMDHSEPKYLNSPETIIFNKRKNLFALNIAKKSKQGRLILTEGYMDAIALHQYGFDCAVASLGTALTEEQITLISKYTDQLVLIYDGDEAGQSATARAIPMLEKTGLQIKILRMQGAKDPDEFLKKFGADRFTLLLNQSENHVQYRLDVLASKFHLEKDDEKVMFLKDAAALVSTLPSPVEREVYGTRAAEAAGVAPEAMKLEVEKAVKKRVRRERKEQQKVDLAPAAAQQPKDRKIRYANLRSALAEENLIRQIVLEPALIDKLQSLKEADFSSPLLGKVFSALCNLQKQGLQVSIAALTEELTSEEMSHISGVCRKWDGVVNEKAVSDCVHVIRQEAEKATISSTVDLMAYRDQVSRKKGYNR